MGGGGEKEGREGLKGHGGAKEGEGRRRGRTWRARTSSGRAAAAPGDAPAPSCSRGAEAEAEAGWAACRSTRTSVSSWITLPPLPPLSATHRAPPTERSLGARPQAQNVLSWGRVLRHVVGGRGVGS
eukprot:3941426-Rhodomonas_salina.2